MSVELLWLNFLKCHNLLAIPQITPTLNSNSISSQNTAPKESRYPIFVALERGLNASAEANIQPASDRVTNIGYLLSLGASSCLWQLLFHWQITISTSFAIAFSVLRNQRDISWLMFDKESLTAWIVLWNNLLCPHQY